MSAVIPKLILNVEALHSARRKIQSACASLQLTDKERQALLSLLTAGKKTLYPDQMALDRYQYHVDQLSKVDPEKNPEMFNRFASRIEEFEQKYCI